MSEYPRDLIAVTTEDECLDKDVWRLVFALRAAGVPAEGVATGSIKKRFIKATTLRSRGIAVLKFGSRQAACDALIDIKMGKFNDADPRLIEKEVGESLAKIGKIEPANVSDSFDLKFSYD